MARLVTSDLAALSPLDRLALALTPGLSAHVDEWLGDVQSDDWRVQAAIDAAVCTGNRVSGQRLAEWFCKVETWCQSTLPDDEWGGFWLTVLETRDELLGRLARRDTDE